MSSPAIGGTSPIVINVEQGKNYWWCTCGLSKNQPFCDGSHKAENLFAPMQYTAEESRKLAFCTCKRTGKSPLCDGSHKSV